MRLPNIPFASRTLKKQKPLLKGTDVRKVQQVLKGLGFLDTRVDGVFGHRTAWAIMRFQRAFKIQSKGIVDKESFAVLYNIINSKPHRWLTYQRDFAHTGYYPLSLSPILKKDWVKPIPDIISLNSQYDRIIVTTQKGVIALDIYDGKKLWKNCEIIPTGVAVLSDALGFIPTGGITVLDIFTGKIKETIDLYNSLAPIAIKGSKLFVPQGGNIYAFEDNGNRLWQYTTSGVLTTPPALGYELVYFSSYDHYIYCVDEKGLLYWKTKTPDIIQHPLCIWDDKVFAVSKDSWVYALNPLTGSILWRKKFSEDEFLIPAFSHNYMLLFNDEGEGFALNPRSAQILWTIKINAKPTLPPVICKNLFFIGTSEGLMVFDTKTMEKSIYIKGEEISALMLVGFNLYVATSDHLTKFSTKL